MKNKEKVKKKREEIMKLNDSLEHITDEKEREAIMWEVHLLCVKLIKLEDKE